MNWMRARVLILISFAQIVYPAMSWAQYAGPPVGAQERAPGAVSQSNPIYEMIRLQPGDLVSVEVYGAPELTSTVGGVRIGAKGELQFPYIGEVVLADLTVKEAAEQISKQLKDSGVLVDPQVSLQIVDSPSLQIAVLGEVRSPKQIPAVAHYRLLDVISACGGFTDQASHVVTIRRRGQDEPITVNLGTDPKAVDERNVLLMPGDTVIVPRVGMVYVTGLIAKPQAVTLAGNQPITALRAITISGGPLFGAALSKTMIIRNLSDGTKLEMIFDLKKVMDGKTADITLQSDDVITLPRSNFKSALAGGAASVAASALYGAAYIAK